jgi:hypothetical protein
VDNSANNDALPQTVVEDPSLYSTLVVTASPIGVDNKIVNLTRADVAAASFGFNSITTDDIEKYGQTIEYPLSILENGNAPVRLLRVTPDGSKYAFSIILVQWYIDRVNKEMHVRFKEGEVPQSLRVDRFQNTDKFNDAIVRGTDSTFDDTNTGIVWQQRVFINAIGAGRGKAYNNFSFAINLGTQNKNPSNCRYIFSTINKSTGLVIEEFAASLSNVSTPNSKKYYSTLDDVNMVVKRRIEGSSIVVPYLNKKAVNDVYNDYINFVNTLKDQGELKDFEMARISTLNINIFDMVFGNYIYDGSLYSAKLPRYSVDMYDTDIVDLPIIDRFIAFDNAYNIKNPYPLWTNLYPKAYGLLEDGDSVYVGDTYINPNNGADKTITVVAAINQYTGAITSVDFKNVFVKNLQSSQTAYISHEIDTVIDLKVDTTLVDAKPDTYVLVSTQPDNWASTYMNYYVKTGSNPDTYAKATLEAPEFNTSKYYWTTETGGTYTQTEPTDWETNFTNYWVSTTEDGEREQVTGQVPTFVSNKYYQLTGETDKFKDLLASNAQFIQYCKNNGIITGDDSTNALVVIAFTESDGTYDICSVLVNGKLGTNGNVVIESIGMNDNPGDVLSILDFNRSGTSNVIGRTIADPAFSKVGALVINNTASTASTPAATIYVNGYDTKYNSETGTVDGTRKYITNNTNKPGIVNDGVNVDNEILGHEYDVIIFADNANSKAVITRATNYIDSLTTATDSGSFFTNVTPSVDVDRSVGTIFTADITAISTGTGVSTLTFKVAEVDNDGIPTKLDFDTCNINYSGTFDTLSDIVLNVPNPEYNPSDHESPKFIKVGTVTINYKDLRPLEFVAAANSTKVDPTSITRYMVTGTTGSLIRVQVENNSIPRNYYSGDFGLNPSSIVGGVDLRGGSTGFFDDTTISTIEFKWRYSALLVKAYRGMIDPRIKSPVRCPAKYLFDGGTNTIVGQTILPNVTYAPYDIINSSTIFTDEEKEAVLLDNSLATEFVDTYNTDNDIDVKQAMYDLMIHRCYYGMPDEMRPIGPGYGLSLHLDAGISDYNTAMLVNDSFRRRFNNPNASWDIGGYTSATNGATYTYTKWLVDNLIRHCKTTSVNKPFVMSAATIPPEEYTSFYPDIDMTDWDMRELLYESGGNAWVPDVNGNLVRRYQRTLFFTNDSSDLIQESNMRTLSQLCYQLQNLVDGAMYSYTDDGVLQTLTDLCNNRFSTWAGNLVETLDISFERDINPLDGTDLVVCYCNVTFRGLFMRVPIIVNVNRRTS